MPDLRPLLGGALLFTSSLAGAQTPDLADQEREVFANAADACLEAQQDGQMSEDEFLSRGFVSQEVPAEFQDRLQIYSIPGSIIGITVNQRDNTCAIRWDAELIAGAPSPVEEVVEAIIQRASEDAAGQVRHAQLAKDERISRYAFAKGDAAGMLIATTGDEYVTFQFVAVNPATQSS